MSVLRCARRFIVCAPWVTHYRMARESRSVPLSVYLSARWTAQTAVLWFALAKDRHGS